MVVDAMVRVAAFLAPEMQDDGIGDRLHSDALR